ncbi:MAG: hypothetical protein L0H29_05440 [Sinobacteraceae bacterium]|nr:hypothetical protein [Nevskiaceae bacterium]
MGGAIGEDAEEATQLEYSHPESHANQAGIAPGSAVPAVIPDARQRDPESSAAVLYMCHRLWIAAFAAITD